MNAGTGDGFASNSSTCPNGFDKVMTSSLSEVALMEATCSIITRPAPSLAPQRFNDATQSSAVTGVPSCHSKPSRSFSV
ncbi:hypothetical protein D9M68_796370 [compost metagenome]